MPSSITIDDIEYQTDSLSDGAKTLIGQLQEIQSHSSYLQSQLGIANIAQQTLVTALKAELPTTDANA